MVQETQKYIVRKKIREAPGISTLELTFSDGSVPGFIPGQYITVYFSDTKTSEGKAYSISSAPGEKTISLTIKAIGEFSNRLCAMQPGNTIIASLPYGYFMNEDNEEKNNLLLLAGGIGIAPFRSIIKDAVKKWPDKKIALFFSSKTLPEMIFKKEFDTIEKSHLNFMAHYFVTREHHASAHITNHRMTTEDILKNLKTPQGLDFMLCGSIAFNRDLWRALCSCGVPEDHISTETFFS